MKVLIRPASAADTNAIALLNDEVQQLHAELEPTFFKTDTSHAEVAAFFAAKLSAAGHEIQLAEIGGTPVGYVWFEVQDRPETAFQLARERIYIHHLSVTKTARRTGVGSALLNAIQTAAMALASRASLSIRGPLTHMPSSSLRSTGSHHSTSCWGSVFRTSALRRSYYGDRSGRTACGERRRRSRTGVLRGPVISDNAARPVRAVLLQAFNTETTENHGEPRSGSDHKSPQAILQ